MEILVTKHTQLKKIQDEFQKCFPFLKLEFYSNLNKQGDSSLKRIILNNNLTIGETPKFNKDSSINIEKSMKVSELEKAFLDSFGINAQVFRKSNHMWLQTTITDNWSLEKQNKNGREMDITVNTKSEADDYHEQK